MKVTERYDFLVMAANSSKTISAPGISGFLCTVSGTLNVSFNGTSAVTDLPVTAGVYYPVPVSFGSSGAVVTLSGGAAGTLLF